MPPNIELEAKVINKFIVPTKRDRYLGFIKNDKTRSKFTRDLSHTGVFKEELFERIIGNEVQVIKDKVRHLGNSRDCYIISENSKIDTKLFTIETALKEAISAWSDTGTLIVFGDAEVIYREAEGINNRWISK